MKKLAFCFLILFAIVEVHSQTDFEIAKQLIGKNISIIDTVLIDFKLEYYKTFEDKNELEFYLVKNNSVRVWNIKYSDIYSFADKNRKVKNMMGENLIYEIFVRYKHSNMNDLREFFANELPKSTNYMIYEKNFGKNVSDIKVVHVGFRTIIENYSK